MKKQYNPIPDWRNPRFVYRPSVNTNILQTLKRFGFIPPSEKKDSRHG